MSEERRATSAAGEQGVAGRDGRGKSGSEHQ